jgi:hypothetical protein
MLGREAMVNLPDDEAVTQVIVHGGPTHELWFNYGTARNRRWGQKELCDHYGTSLTSQREERRGGCQ